VAVSVAVRPCRAWACDTGQDVAHSRPVGSGDLFQAPRLDGRPERVKKLAGLLRRLAERDPSPSRLELVAEPIA
jgi:hypothetical protein